MKDKNFACTRETDTARAVKDIVACAMCNEFTGTACFTVAHYVRAQNELMNAGTLCFGVNELIGDYTVGGTATFSPQSKCDPVARAATRNGIFECDALVRYIYNPEDAFIVKEWPTSSSGKWTSDARDLSCRPIKQR